VSSIIQRSPKECPPFCQALPDCIKSLVIPSRIFGCRIAHADPLRAPSTPRQGSQLDAFPHLQPILFLHSDTYLGWTRSSLISRTRAKWTRYPRRSLITLGVFPVCPDSNATNKREQPTRCEAPRNCVVVWDRDGNGCTNRGAICRGGRVAVVLNVTSSPNIWVSASSSCPMWMLRALTPTVC